MRALEAKSFGEFIQARLKLLPNNGRGGLRRLALDTGLHVTSLSQSIKGQRQSSLEHTAKICECLGTNELETRFCIVLVQYERAGTTLLRDHYKRELQRIRDEATDLVNLVKKDKLLTESEKAIFYSNWFYSGIAVLSSLPEYQTISAIAEKIKLSQRRVNQVVEFLTRSGICAEKKGRIQPGTQSTHLEADSPLVSRHHSNWRVKAMERHPSLERESELAYSSPMSLSKEDAIRIRKLLSEMIEEIAKIRDPSPCEEAYCLNIDWIKFS